MAKLVRSTLFVPPFSNQLKSTNAGSADRRFCGPRLFRSYDRHRAVFYRPSADGSDLRRPFLSDRYFFIVVRLLRRREKFTEPDFALLARAFNRARALHPFYLTAWVSLPDHWP